jgi:hypothetical protein
MLSNDLKNKTTQYISIYDELKSKLRWKVAHNQILMLISSAYIVNKRDFDFQRFYNLSSYIKSNIGSFSTLNSHHRFTVASILDIHFQHEAEQAFLTFIDVYNQMVRLGYKRDIFTYISALIFRQDRNDKPKRTDEHGALCLSADEEKSLFSHFNSKCSACRIACPKRKRVAGAEQGRIMLPAAVR